MPTTCGYSGDLCGRPARSRESPCACRRIDGAIRRENLANRRYVANAPLNLDVEAGEVRGNERESPQPGGGEREVMVELRLGGCDRDLNASGARLPSRNS